MRLIWKDCLFTINIKKNSSNLYSNLKLPKSYLKRGSFQKKMLKAHLICQWWHIYLFSLLPPQWECSNFYCAPNSCVAFQLFCFNICFRAELNRQKQHSLKLGMQIESDCKIIAEVCLRHADAHSAKKYLQTAMFTSQVLTVEKPLTSYLNDFSRMSVYSIILHSYLNIFTCKFKKH